MPISNRLNSYLNLLDTIDTKSQSITLGQGNQPVVEKKSFIVNFIRWFIRLISCHHLILNPKLDTITRGILDVAPTEETTFDSLERKRVIQNLKKLKVIVITNCGSELRALKAVIQKIKGVQKLNNRQQVFQATVEDIPEIEKKLNRDDPNYIQQLEQLAVLCESGIEKDPSLAQKAVDYSTELAERLLNETKHLAASHHYMRALKICRKQTDLKEKTKTLEETLVPIYDSILVYYFNIFNTKKSLQEFKQEYDEILKTIKNVIENAFSIPGGINSQYLLNAAAFADTFPELYEGENPFSSHLEELYKKSIEIWEKEIIHDFDKLCKEEEKQPDYCAHLKNRVALRYVSEGIEQKKSNIQAANVYLEKALELNPNCMEARKVLFKNYMSLLEPAKGFWDTLGKFASYVTGKDILICEKAFELMPDEYGSHIFKLIEHYAHKSNPKALELKLKWPNTPISQSTINQLSKLELVKKIETALENNNIKEAERLFEPAKSFAKGSDLELLKTPFANHYIKIINQTEFQVYISHKMTPEEIKTHVLKNRSAFIALLDAYNNLLGFYPEIGIYYFQKAQLVDFFNLKDISELAETFQLTSKTALECFEMAIKFKRNHFFALSYQQCLSEYNKLYNTQMMPSAYLSSIPQHHIVPAQKQMLDLWMRDRFIVKVDYSKADLL